MRGETRTVTRCSIVDNGVQFNIWDTPGFHGFTETDDVILDNITTQLKQECTHIHLMVYCLRMDIDRIGFSEELAIKRLTDCFGPKIWEISVFALTFANKVYTPPDMDTDELAPKYFEQRLEDYKHQIINILVNKCRMYASEIAVIPTGYHRPTRWIPNQYMLPDRDDWFNPFWITCAERIQETPLSRFQYDRIEIISGNNPKHKVKQDKLLL